MLRICVAIGLLSTGLLWGNERTLNVPNSNIQVKLWTQLNSKGEVESYYEFLGQNGRSLAKVGQPIKTSYDIKLLHGDFDPMNRVPQVVSGLEAASDNQIYIVQFHTQPIEAYRTLLKELGAKVRFFMANHAHLVEMDASTRNVVEALDIVRWVGPYHPAYRMESYLRERVLTSGELHGFRPYNIMLFESNIEVKKALAAKIEKIGGKVRMVDAGKFLQEASLTRDMVVKVSQMNEVLFIDRWSEMEADMDKAREYGGANYIETVAGFTGVGVRGEVFDTGFNVGHVDFSSRPLIEHTAMTSDSHGASTSGIVFGDGTGNANARGMLPDGQGIVAVYSGIMEGPRYQHTEELLQAPYFAVFQTSSVGSNRTADYTTLSADMDAMLFDLDIVHCQSQSNAGSTQSRPQAWAKNIISGGAINHQNTVDPSDDCWCSGASIGPATDGRIKPDLCAYYDSILTTTTGSSTAYTSGFGGTSGATPIIAGHVGLFFDMWSNGVFENEVTPGATVFENKSHMTTAKAMMINTAKSYEFTGANVDLTRVHQGWGFPDLQKMYDSREKFLIVDEEKVLTNLGTATYDVEVLPGQVDFRATLVFADPAGLPSSSQHRINDLSLRVTSPTGTVYWGNNGLLEGNWSVAGGDANHIDTVENVFVENPEVGFWLVEVIAHEINQDGHVETPEVDADFALVVSGVEKGGFFNMEVDATFHEVCAGTPLVLNLDILQIDGYTGTVDFSLADAPAGLNAVFAPTSVVTPGQATLTLSNFVAVAQGLHQFQIVAESPEMTRHAVVNIHVAHVAPGLPGAVSPLNGATEVSLYPEISWDSLPEATSYQIQVSADSGFGTLVVDEVLTGSSIQITNRLDSLTPYYWRVKAMNACGDNGFSSTFNFVTLDQQDYFTETFSAGFDLENAMVTFTPNGTGNFYNGCFESITDFPTDPTGGTGLSLTDDSFEALTLGTAVSLYGEDYSTVYIGSNGFITFNTGDTSRTGAPEDHFAQPRISALYMDLNPESGGSVSYQELADRFVLTFENVPRYNQTDSNSYQIEMFHDGVIRVSWLGIGSPSGLAGISAGGGLPVDFLTSDLSDLGCGCIAVGISGQPQDAEVCEGGTLELSVLANGTTPSYQWRVDGQNIAGANSATLSIPGVTAGDAGFYDCVVSNDCGSATSGAAEVVIMPNLQPDDYHKWLGDDPCGDTNGDNMINIIDLLSAMMAL